MECPEEALHTITQFGMLQQTKTLPPKCTTEQCKRSTEWPMDATTNRLKIRSQQCRPQQLSRSKKFRQRRNCKRKLWLNTAESQSPRPCPDLRIPSMRNANVISAGHRPRCQQHPVPNNQNYHEHATTSASD